MSEVVLLAGAQADLLELYTRFGERGYFLVVDELELIRKMPEIAPVYADPFRRRLVVGTPYGIFYSLAGKRIMVAAILDLRQDPRSILRRLGG